MVVISEVVGGLSDSDRTYSQGSGDRLQLRDRPIAIALALLVLFILKSPSLPAEETSLAVPDPIQEFQGLKTAARAKISIIIDDLGYTWPGGLRAISLPGAVAYSILPFTRFSTRLAIEAHRNGKEVLLHMPMEPEQPQAESPGTLRHDMGQDEFLSTLRAGLDAVPHAIGINNHMGSLLTQQPRAMTWLMEELKKHGRLFFVDSRTSPASVANRYAQLHGLAHLPRNVFLDHTRDTHAIELRFDELIAHAKQRGFALAIGHPYPETLAILERRLATLGEAGIELVPVSQSVYPPQAKIAAAGGTYTEDAPSQTRAPLFARVRPLTLPAP